VFPKSRRLNGIIPRPWLEALHVGLADHVSASEKLFADERRCPFSIPAAVGRAQGGCWSMYAMTGPGRLGPAGGGLLL
jgi:hypothetical protein